MNRKNDKKDHEDQKPKNEPSVEQEEGLLDEEQLEEATGGRFWGTTNPDSPP
jgi:hypothetical protein